MLTEQERKAVAMIKDYSGFEFELKDGTKYHAQSLAEFKRMIVQC